MAFAPMPARRQGNPLKIVLPLVVFAAAIAAWEAIVRIEGVPPYILPAPSLIARTLVADWSLLSGSLLTTLGTTLAGLVLAVLGGVVLAVLLSLSRIVEYSLYPFAVVLQVTPVIAIAPLLLIYMPQDVAVLSCAWLVAFFPVLSNTMLGLQSVDRNLMELFQLYGAPASRGPLARLRARLKALWLSWRACGLRAGSPSSAPWLPRWPQVRQGRARGWPTASSRASIGSTFRASLQLSFFWR
jgi:NitT/TauT family transport system permease protein